MSSSYDTDLAIVGAGQAGVTAALLADRLGARVTLIEADRIGGSYLWHGSIPSLTLAQSARVQDMVQRSEEFGVHLEKPRVVWAAVRLRIADVRDQIRTRQREALAATKVEVIMGQARFADPHQLTIETSKGTRTLTARNILLATGSRPQIPNIDGLEDTPYLLPEGLLARPTKPHSLLILGGGPRAAELAQAFQRLGTKVTLVSPDDRLLPGEEEAISSTLERFLTNEGVQLRLGTKAVQAGVEEGKKWVEIGSNGRPSGVEVGSEGGPKGVERGSKGGRNGENERLEGGEMVVIGGNSPCFEDLNLSAAGVDTDGAGIRVSARMQTSAPHIFACGNVASGEFSAHGAEFEARIAVRNALLSGRGTVTGHFVPAVTYTDPEVAHIGLTAAEAKADLGNIRTYEVRFETLDRAVILGETSGFANIVTSNSGRILGAHIVGPSAGEIISAFIPAVRDGALLQEFAEAVYPSPTLSAIANRLGLEIYSETLSARPLKLS